MRGLFCGLLALVEKSSRAEGASTSAEAPFMNVVRGCFSILSFIFCIAAHAAEEEALTPASAPGSPQTLCETSFPTLKRAERFLRVTTHFELQ